MRGRCGLCPGLRGRPSTLSARLVPELPLPFLQANLFPAALVHFGAEEPAGEWVLEQGLLLGLEGRPVV